MGGKSTSEQSSFQTSNSQTNPWERTMPALDTLIGQTRNQFADPSLTANQSNALDGLAGSTQSNQFLPQINNVAAGLLSGGPDRTGYATRAYDDMRASTLPYTTMDTNPYSNEAFTKATDYLTDDITNRVNSQYAGAGYSPVRSGDYGKTLAEGVSRGIAPAWLQASNDLENRKLGAISGLYNAGNTTAGLLSGLDQNKFNNQQAGVSVAGTAQGMAQNQADMPFMRMLEVEAQRRGIPIQNLAQFASLIVPMAQLGGTSNSSGYGRQEGSKTMSGAEQFKTIASGIGSLMPKFPITMGG